jgi:flagellar biosynthetic protein FliS
MRVAAAYRRADLASASNEDLLLRLLEKALQHMYNADVAIEEGRRGDLLHHLHFARAIVLELANAFDRETAPDAAVSVLTTYRWMLHQLVEAGRHRDRARLALVREAAETLLDAWTEAVRISREGPALEEAS